MALIQRTAGSIKATNEYLFDLLDKIKAKEQFDFDIKMEIIFVTDENVCFSFTGEEKIYHYIYTPDDKGELTFAEEKEDYIYSFASVTTNIIAKYFSDKSIKSDFKKNKVSIEEVKANMQDVFVTTIQAHDKPVTFVEVRMLNGFTVCESTTCVDPANYDEEIGKQVCLKRIEDKIFMLLGYVKQCEISAQYCKNFYMEKGIPLDIINIEYSELSDRLGRLEKFMRYSKYFSMLDNDIKAMIIAKHDILSDYLGILGTLSTRLENKEGGFTGLSFGIAIYLLKSGFVIRRSCWSNKNRLIFKRIYEDGTEHLMSSNAVGDSCTWFPSTSDVLAKDWELIKK